MPARRMGWVMERRVVRGVVRVGGDIVGRVGLGMGMEWREKGRRLCGTMGEVLLVVRVDELESSMLFCCSESARSGIKMWGAEVKPNGDSETRDRGSKKIVRKRDGESRMCNRDVSLPNTAYPPSSSYKSRTQTRKSIRTMPPVHAFLTDMPWATRLHPICTVSTTRTGLERIFTPG